MPESERDREAEQEPYCEWNQEVAPEQVSGKEPERESERAREEEREPWCEPAEGREIERD